MKNLIALFVISHLIFHIKCLDVATLVSDLVKEIFGDGTICYVSDKNLFNCVMEKAFIMSETKVISLSYNRLKHVTDHLPCSGYVLALQNGYDFLKYHAVQKRYTFAFKPWTRLLLLYESPPLNFDDLYLPSANSALDILILDLPKEICCLNFNHEDVVVNVTSLYKNSTLTWRPKQNVIDWTKIGPAKWTPALRHGLSKSKFTVALFQCPPFVEINKSGEVKRGLEVYLIREIIKDVPVNFEIIDSGSEVDPWFLSSELVQMNVTDMAICSHWYISTYEKIVDFTYPVRQICSTFLVRKPTLLPDFTFIFQQLQGEVYLVTLVMLVFVSFLVMVEWYFYNTIEDVNRTSDYVLHFLYLLRILTLGGVSSLPLFKMTSAKFLLGCWCWYCLIFTTYYSAGMTSCLTNPRYQNDVGSLQDMVDSNVHWFMEISTFQQYLLGFNVSLLNSLANLFVKKHKNLETLETSATMVKTVERRYVTEVNEMPYETRKYYKVLNDCIENNYVGFLLQKNSPYTKLFEEAIVKLVESGIYGNWVEYILDRAEDTQRTFFTNYIEEPERHINLKKIQGAFFLLAGGCILGFASFVVEYCIGKNNRRDIKVE